MSSPSAAVRAKQRTLGTFRGENMLLAVAEKVNLELPDACQHAIKYKSRVRVTDVLEKLGQMDKK